ncbi:MAG: HD domain-containing protein [Thermodesulfovibrionales bacterium]
MDSQSIVDRARRFAEEAHSSINQRRKYTGAPYITHPEAVVRLVRTASHTEAMLAAAWLHDTVEDTPVTLADIERKFGSEVARLVEELTDVSRPEDGNRKTRKAIDQEHTAKASPEGQTIKLADLIDNTHSIVERDPGFAKVYLAEKVQLLEMLREGDPILWAIASNFCAVALRYLETKEEI